MELLESTLQVFKLKDLLNRISKPVEVEKAEIYTQIGIRSHGKGIFVKEPVTGESLGNKRVFWIEPDCLIVNIVFAWERAVSKTTPDLNGLIASHRFPMYKTKKNVNLDYLMHYLLTPKGKKLLEDASPGGAGRNKTLSQKDFMESKIQLPSLELQKYISSFLETIERKIQLQQQKIDLLQDQKKEYMQKIFEQKLRFKNELREYYPDWEEHTLNDLGETYTGLSGKTKEDFGIGEHSFVTNVFNNLFAKESGVEKVIIEENEKQNYVKTGDIFLTTSSETPKEVGMASIWKHESRNLHLNSFCFGYRVTSSKVLPEFLAISLRSEYMRKKITILAQGSTRYNISKTELMKEMVYVPSISEQKKIVEFYLNLSSTLELEMQKLVALKEQKKGFIQQMFI